MAFLNLPKIHGAATASNIALGNIFFTGFQSLGLPKVRVYVRFVRFSFIRPPLGVAISV